MEAKKINLSISEGKAFFSHEASINFSPAQFIFDFRCITPRIDPRSTEAPNINIEHNVIMVDPFHAKKVHELLGKMPRVATNVDVHILLYSTRYALSLAKPSRFAMLFFCMFDEPPTIGMPRRSRTCRSMGYSRM